MTVLKSRPIFSASTPLFGDGVDGELRDASATVHVFVEGKEPTKLDTSRRTCMILGDEDNEEEKEQDGRHWAVVDLPDSLWKTGSVWIVFCIDFHSLTLE